MNLVFSVISLILGLILCVRISITGVLIHNLCFRLSFVRKFFEVYMTVYELPTIFFSDKNIREVKTLRSFIYQKYDRKLPKRYGL